MHLNVWKALGMSTVSIQPRYMACVAYTYKLPGRWGSNKHSSHEAVTRDLSASQLYTTCLGQRIWGSSVQPVPCIRHYPCKCLANAASTASPSSQICLRKLARPHCRLGSPGSFRSKSSMSKVLVKFRCSIAIFRVPSGLAADVRCSSGWLRPVVGLQC